MAEKQIIFGPNNEEIEFPANILNQTKRKNFNIL